MDRFYRTDRRQESQHPFVSKIRDSHYCPSELIAPNNLPYKNDMIKALDLAAEMADWGSPLPEGNGLATISVMVHTVSISKAGVLKLERADVAHETGFSLVNPLSVKKQIEGQITWVYNDGMLQAIHVEDGHIVENNFDRFAVSRINEDPPEINIRFFKTT